MTPQALICLAGPTAVGKSEIAQSLARKIGGEIVTVDSMQVYSGLDIGTAKPSAKERSQVPHHLIDIADITEPFHVAAWLSKAHEAVHEIRRRQRRPILCGGTGLYFKAYLEGLGEAPAPDTTLRQTIEQTPVDELLAELEIKDPVMFQQIDRSNPRRVFRAVEVVRLSRRAFSEQRAPWRGGEVGSEAERKGPKAVFIGVEREREDLRNRIDARVDRMFELGLVEETKSLMGRGLEENRNAMQAIGYRQVVEHLRGARTLVETKALIKIRTRQYARRQMTWFRHQADLTWVMVRPDENLDKVAESVAKLVNEATALHSQTTGV